MEPTCTVDHVLILLHRIPPPEFRSLRLFILKRKSATSSDSKLITGNKASSLLFASLISDTSNSRTAPKANRLIAELLSNHRVPRSRNEGSTPANVSIVGRPSGALFGAGGAARSIQSTLSAVIWHCNCLSLPPNPPCATWTPSLGRLVNCSGCRCINNSHSLLTSLGVSPTL